jgi:3-hydroxyacyl-CoA dehydrogenase
MPPEALIVELMTDGHTYNEIFPFMADRLKEAGLHPIVALRESTGFVFNRIWAAIKRETLKVLAEGVSTPSEIDRVFKEQYSARDGPCHMMDQVGLDTVENIEEHYVKERGISRSHLDWLHSNYISAGKLGKKTPGQGGLYVTVVVSAETLESLHSFR